MWLVISSTVCVLTYMNQYVPGHIVYGVVLLPAEAADKVLLRHVVQDVAVCLRSVVKLWLVN